uniref:HDC06899 n=1 Tax=Drosophila melanogaster TaxID=7227 RepID=Q6IG97_DROME|nr:TPA_inf: HDC06899 [Drosophila melanogaster]
MCIKCNSLELTQAQDPDDQQETEPSAPAHHHQLASGLLGSQSPGFGLDLWPIVWVLRVTWKCSS